MNSPISTYKLKHLYDWDTWMQTSHPHISGKLLWHCNPRCFSWLSSESLQRQRLSCICLGPGNLALQSSLLPGGCCTADFGFLAASSAWHDFWAMGLCWWVPLDQFRWETIHLSDSGSTSFSHNIRGGDLAVAGSWWLAVQTHELGYCHKHVLLHLLYCARVREIEREGRKAHRDMSYEIGEHEWKLSSESLGCFLRHCHPKLRLWPISVATSDTLSWDKCSQHLEWSNKTQLIWKQSPASLRILVNLPGWNDMAPAMGKATGFDLTLSMGPPEELTGISTKIQPWWSGWSTHLSWQQAQPNTNQDLGECFWAALVKRCYW